MQDPSLDVIAANQDEIMAYLSHSDLSAADKNQLILLQMQCKRLQQAKEQNQLSPEAYRVARGQQLARLKTLAMQYGVFANLAVSVDPAAEATPKRFYADLREIILAEASSGPWMVRVFHNLAMLEQAGTARLIIYPTPEVARVPKAQLSNLFQLLAKRYRGGTVTGIDERGTVTLEVPAQEAKRFYLAFVFPTSTMQTIQRIECQAMSADWKERLDPATVTALVKEVMTACREQLVELRISFPSLDDVTLPLQGRLRQLQQQMDEDTLAAADYVTMLTDIAIRLRALQGG